MEMDNRGLWARKEKRIRKKNKNEKILSNHSIKSGRHAQIKIIVSMFSINFVTGFEFYNRLNFTTTLLWIIPIVLWPLWGFYNNFHSQRGSFSPVTPSCPPLLFLFLLFFFNFSISFSKYPPSTMANDSHNDKDNDIPPQRCKEATIDHRVRSNFFSQYQRDYLEAAFQALEGKRFCRREFQKMITIATQKLNLSRTQIRTWIKNRRQRGNYKGKNQFQLDQVCCLEVYFRCRQFPNTKEKYDLAQILKVPPKRVQKWFQTRRQRGSSTMFHSNGVCFNPPLSFFAILSANVKDYLGLSVSKIIKDREILFDDTEFTIYPLSDERLWEIVNKEALEESEEEETQETEETDRPSPTTPSQNFQKDLALSLDNLLPPLPYLHPDELHSSPPYHNTPSPIRRSPSPLPEHWALDTSFDCPSTMDPGWLLNPKWSLPSGGGNLEWVGEEGVS